MQLDGCFLQTWSRISLRSCYGSYLVLAYAIPHGDFVVAMHSALFLFSLEPDFCYSTCDQLVDRFRDHTSLGVAISFIHQAA